MGFFKGGSRGSRRSVRRAPAGRRRKPNGNGGGPAAVLPILGIAALVIGAGVIYALLPETVERDPDTMCPVTGPASVTAVLIDTTGNFDPMTRAGVLQEMELLLDESTGDDLVTVYQMRGDAPEEPPTPENPFRWPLPEPIVTVCNPGDPDAASPLFQNPAMIRRALDERYLSPLRAVVSDLVREDALADWSPLIETIQTVRINFLSAPEFAAVPQRIVMVTDLIQNSPVLTFNRGRDAARSGGGFITYEEFASTAPARALAVDLSGVDVEVLFVEREAHATVAADTRTLVDWWDAWFSDHGAMVRRVKRLPGMS